MSGKRGSSRARQHELLVGAAERGDYDNAMAALQARASPDACDAQVS